MKYFFSIACIVRDEQDYIEEFVAYHLCIGANHLFIYDNDSKIPVKQILAAYIEAGLVDVIDFPGNGVQQEFHSDCLNRFGNFSKWIAFIDCDEFIVPRSKETMSEILLDYEQYGGVGINWKFFGSNGHLIKPGGLVIENYLGAGPNDWCLHTHIKSIVQPERVSKIGGDPHWFIYKEPFYAVSEQFVKIPASVSHRCEECISKGCFIDMHISKPISLNKFCLHHYYTKSYDEYVARVKRSAAHLVEESGRKLKFFHEISDICNIQNKETLRFVDETKKLILKYRK